jgi:hypothetical protein
MASVRWLTHRPSGVASRRARTSAATLPAISAVLAGGLIFGLAGPALAQFGGFGNDDVKIMAEFDKDGNGMLDRAERDAARRYLGTLPRRGFRRYVRDSQPQQGRKLTPADVKTYTDEPLYDPLTLRTLFFEFEDLDWEAQMADFHGTDAYLPGKLVVDGKEYKAVGARFRGLSSFMQVAPGKKRSIALSMDMVHSKQRLNGYRSINLLNAHTDPTYLRSVLYLDIVRHYIPAPKANFVRVVINGEDWGIYVSQEQFNSDFTKEAFNSTKGARWKVPGNPRAVGGLGYRGDDPNVYKRIYEIHTKDTPESWADLIRLCKVLSTTPADRLEAALEPILDIDGALKFLALDKTLINNDGYWIRMSDYSIYEDENKKFHVIPHDANETLRDPEMGWGGGTNAGLSLNPLAGTTDSNKALFRLLEVPKLRAKYFEYVRDIAQNWLDWRKMGPVARQYHDLIAEDVKRDVHKLDSYEEFEQGFAGLIDNGGGFGFNSPPGVSLRTFFEQRRAYLLSLPEVNPAAAKAGEKEAPKPERKP